jgi:hypothetical protein
VAGVEPVIADFTQQQQQQQPQQQPQQQQQQQLRLCLIRSNVYLLNLNAAN